MDRQDPKPKDLSDPTYNLSDFKVQLTGGSLRWFATVCTIGGLAAGIWFVSDKGEPDIPFPIHMKGQTVYWAVGAATIFWLLISIVNWRNWRKEKTPTG